MIRKYTKPFWRKIRFSKSLGCWNVRIFTESYGYGWFHANETYQRISCFSSLSSSLRQKNPDDREFPNAKAGHRNHLTEKANFKQVIPIPSKEIVDKIARTYRLQFLKDVALARLLDDNTFSFLNSLIFFNQVDIVNYFHQNHVFLNDLFIILNQQEDLEEGHGRKLELDTGGGCSISVDNGSNGEGSLTAVSVKGKKKDVVMFLYELCGIAKHLQPSTRTLFYRSV
jgi:protein phosphatase-4 regulatory subunit 3